MTAHRNSLFIAFILITGLASGVSSDPGIAAFAPPPPGLWTFNSDFESDISVGSPEIANGEWRQSLQSGSTGRPSWSSLPGYFAYLVRSSEDLSKFAATRIEEVAGPDGAPTSALYQEVLRDNPGTRANTRNAYTMLPPVALLDSGVVRYRMKLQSNLEEVLPPGESSWRMLMEWREAEPGPGKTRHGYRIALYVMRGGPTLAWKLEANDLLPRDRVEWTLNNDVVPVPVGEWFTLEASWIRSTGRSGRIAVRVNGKEVFDRVGPTSKGGRLHQWHVFKVYTGANSLARGPAYQWIDDVEMSFQSMTGFQLMAGSLPSMGRRTR